MTSIFAVAEVRGAPSTGERTGFAAIMLRFVERMIAARQRAYTRSILSGLDDLALKDIGLTRGEIDAVERDPRYDPRFPGF